VLICRGVDDYKAGLITIFRLLRDFTLDTRGNRTFVDSYNASLGLVVSDDYDLNDDNNLYGEINGLSCSVDAKREAGILPARVAAVPAALVGGVLAADSGQDGCRILGGALWVTGVGAIFG